MWGMFLKTIDVQDVVQKWEIVMISGFFVVMVAFAGSLGGFSVRSSGLRSWSIGR